jgi:hypothetical protein
MGYSGKIRNKKNKNAPYAINNEHFYFLDSWDDLNIIHNPINKYNILTPLTKEDAERLKTKYETNDSVDKNVHTYSVVNESEAMLPYLYDNLCVTFYKEDLSLPISAGDCIQYWRKQYINQVCHILRSFINKKKIIYLTKQHKKKFLYSELIYFCELEGIDWEKGLEIETILKDNGDVDMIVNEIK